MEGIPQRNALVYPCGPAFAALALTAAALRLPPQILKKPRHKRSLANLCVVDLLASTPLFRGPGWSWPMRRYLYTLADVKEFKEGECVPFFVFCSRVERVCRVCISEGMVRNSSITLATVTRFRGFRWDAWCCASLM